MINVIIRSYTIIILLWVFVFHGNNVLTIEEAFMSENIKIETERLILRLIDISDVADIFEFSSDPVVAKFNGVFEKHKNSDETCVFIKNYLNNYQQYKTIPWAIVYKPNNKVIGFFGFFYTIKHHKVELGYVLSRDYWNQGLATEATRAVVQFGFNNFNIHRISASFDPRNVASGKVLEKSGFVYEGTLKNYYFLNNEMCDRIIVSIVK